MLSCRKLSGCCPFRALSVGIIAAGTLAVAGCGGTSKSSQSTAATASKGVAASKGTATSEVNNSAVLLQGVAESKANPYGYSNHLAFVAAAKVLGTEVKSVESIPESQYTSTFTSFAERKTGLIVGAGEEFQETIYELAPKFPESTFVCVTCAAESNQPKNVVNLRPNFVQVNYLGGVAAGLTTTSNKVGDIMGLDFPDLKESAKGFEDGVKAVNPKATVTDVVAGTFEDPSKVRAAAQALIGKGADVIRHEANGAGAGLFDAVKGTKVWAVGSYLNQMSLAPDNVLVSTAPELTKGYTAIAEDYKSGKLTPTYELDFADKGILVTPINKKAPNAAHVESVVKEYETKILNGAIKLPEGAG